ncbi:unnamed protein product [Mytilus edulis]|uniref:C-type lectin domain-containing protein n=1 Tax=Mytilus edulis TaxID=6550 RepID=A0A8S3VE78_MYTED|nr:unnamed protein product [Mytilus edulis]
MGDKKNKKSTADILQESRHVLYGDEVEVATVLENVLTLLNRMDTRLVSIEKNTSKNTSTLTQMNDKLNSLTARVITVETDIVNVKSRVSDLETSSEGTGNLFDEVKSKTCSLEKDIEQLKRNNGDGNDSQSIKDELRKLESYNEKLKGKLLDMQCRSMKYNLIFTGLQEQRDENCEMKIRQFIHNEMKIQKPLEFGNIHRFGKSEPGKPRPIIARFLYYSDLDMVKKAGRNLRGTFYGVNEQFPPEIEEQRRKLYPIAKQARKEKLKVVMKRDKLYINDKLVKPDEIADDTEHKEPQRSTTRPNKRPRVNSTPERDETKTDDLDVIDLPGYKFVMKNRSHLNRVKSGGIVLGFKESLSDHISVVETDSKYILWFKIDKHVVKLQQDILCGIVYIPPENSVYCVGDPFSEIESEFLNFSISHDNICLFGDFNARTAEESDFDVVNFEEFSGMLDIENEGVCTLDELNINRLRKSMDHKKNNFGNLLLEFCKNNNMFILNGRMCEDKGLGSFTCKNTSVVDYNIASPNFLKLVQNFSVLNSSVLFSDIHNPLSLKITCYEKQNDVSHDDEMPEEKIKRWENEQLDTFISNIDRLKVNEILAQLTEMVENTSENSIINKVVEDVCHLLTNAAKSTFGTFTKRRKHTQNIKKSKPWFDSEFVADSMKWCKSDMIGSYTANDVLYSMTVRSKTECTVICSYDSSCQSCLYEQTEHKCTLLFFATQSGPLVFSNERVFISANVPLMSVPMVITCCHLVEFASSFLPNYLTWSESEVTCNKEGTDLAVLNSDVLFMEFLYYMDNVTKLTLRVSVSGTIDGNYAKWKTGEIVDPNRFCPGRPATLNKLGICLYIKPAQEYETCHPVNRIIDDRCKQDRFREFV